MREKKAMMAANLRERCAELAELEKENKRLKNARMVGAGGGTSSVKDTVSVAGASTKTGVKATHA